MSANVFEIIVKKEIAPYDKVFSANPNNNLFNDFSYSQSLNQDVPNFWTIEGLTSIQDLWDGAIKNSAFDLGFNVVTNSLGGNSILSSFQTPDSWEVRTFSIDNHGLSQNKSELSEESTSNGYDYYTGSERIIPKLFLNSQTSSYEGADILAANSITGTFTNGDLTGWSLVGTNSTDGVADYAWVTTTSGTIAIRKVFSNTDVFEVDSVYEVSFERISSTASMRCRVDCFGNVFKTSYSATAGVEKLYFTPHSLTTITISFESESSGTVVKFDNVTVKKVIQTQRVGDTDSFAYLPDPSSEKGFAQPNHRYSLDPSKMLDFGCFQTLNVFQEDWSTRQNTVQGTFGNTSRFIKYESSDAGINNGDTYSSSFKNKWFYPTIFCKDKESPTDEADSIAPTVLRLRDVFNPLDVGKKVKFTANVKFDKDATNSTEVLTDAYPNFSTSALGAELISNSQFLSGNTNWSTSDSDWTFSNGQAVYNSDGTVGSLKQPLTVVGGKTYVLQVHLQDYSGSEEDKFVANFSHNSSSEKIDITSGRKLLLTASGSGSISTNLKIYAKYGNTFNARINFVSLVESGKINLETPILGEHIIDNFDFSNGSEGWVEHDANTTTFNTTTNRMNISIVNFSNGNNRAKTDVNVFENSKEYKLTYKVASSNITTLEFWEGSSWISIPFTVGTHQLTFTASADHRLYFNAKHSSASGTFAIVFDSISLKEVLDKSTYITSSTDLKIKSISDSYFFNDYIYRLKLNSGQSYRFFTEIDGATDISYGGLAIQTDTGTILDSFDLLTSDPYSGLTLSKDFETPQDDSGYVHIVVKAFANFTSKNGEISFDKFRFSTNTINHEHITKGSLSGSGINASSDFIITTSDFKSIDAEGLVEYHYTDSSNNVFSESTSSSEFTLKEDVKNVISKREFCNPFKGRNKNYLDSETYTINPSIDCPKDSEGYYTGAAFDVTAEINIGSAHLNFFADSFSTDYLMNSTMELHSITFETCEDAYITKDPSTANALRIHYDSSQTNTKAPEAVSFDLPSNLVNSGSEVNVAWNLQSLSGNLVIDFDNDDGNSAVISSSGSGNQTLSVDGEALRIRTLRGDELSTLGSNLLTNDSFTSTSDWTAGSAWNITGGQAVISSAQTSSPNPTSLYNVLGLRQDSVLTSGDTYDVIIDVASSNSHPLRISLGAGSNPLTDNSFIFSQIFTAGTHTVRGIASGTDFMILADQEFVGAINSIQVKKVTAFASSNVTAVLNSITITQVNKPTEFRCEKWGDETTSNNNLGKGIGAFEAGARLFSSEGGGFELKDSSDPVTISTKIKSTKNKDVVTLAIGVAYMEAGNTITVTHNLTSPSITTTQTITSANDYSFVYNNTANESGGGLDERFLKIKFNSDGSNPLDCVLSDVNVTIKETAEDSEAIYLDLYDDFTLPINISKKDFRNLDSINGDYTKSITVPATSNNKKAIEFSNELNSIISSEQKNGFETIVKSGGVKVFQGLLFLSETTYDENGSEQLVLNIKSGNSTWAEKLKNKRLRSLESDDYDISVGKIVGGELLIGSSLEVEIPSITARNALSILTANNKEIFFPLIDNGKIYEDIDGNRSVGWDNIKPAYRISSVIEKIFESINYSIDSEFFRGGSEFSSEFNSEFSSYIQNLIGIAPSIITSEEQIEASEIDLSYSAGNSFTPSGGFMYNSFYQGKEPSKFAVTSKSNPRPRLRSVFLSESENEYGISYFCDWAYLRFDTVNKDLNSGHSLDSLQGVLPHFFVPKSGASTPSKIGGNVSPQKSFIKVAKSGFYEVNISVKLDVHLSRATDTIYGVRDTLPTDGEKITVALIPNKLEDPATPFSNSNLNYLDNTSFGTECFDLEDDASIQVPKAISAENLRINITRNQYLSSNITYNVIVIHGAPLSDDSNGVIGGKEFTVKEADLNLKLSESPYPLRGKGNLIYNDSATPKANYSNILPDVSCLEFVSEFSKIFNLVWDVNEATKSVTFEPFNDFYKFNGSRVELDSTPAREQSWYDYSGLSDFTAVEGTVASVNGDGANFTIDASPTSTPQLQYTNAITTTKGVKYSLQFSYSSFRKFQVWVGSGVGKKDVLISPFIEKYEGAPDVNQQAGIFTTEFTAQSSSSYLTFVIKDGINLGSETYKSVLVNDFLIVGESLKYVDWTNKSLITSSNEHYVVESDIRFKMKEDSSDYEVTKSSSGTKGVKFGDRFIETGIKKSGQEKQIELSIFAPMYMGRSKFIVEGESFFLPRIWSKPKSSLEPNFFEDLPDPNNEHEHKLAVFGRVETVPNDKKVVYSLNALYNYSTKRIEYQRVSTPAYALTVSYSDFEIDSPSLTFSNILGKSNSKNIYDDFHAPLINMLAIRDKMVTAQVQLSYSDLNDIDFRDIIHIDGNIYILNKVKDFNFSGEPTEVELLLVTLTK